ncbi:MAG TPA: hypothetical protein VF240_03695 [Pyrinomonadaceae bacterium]
MPVAHVNAPHYERAAEVETLVRDFVSCTLPWSDWTHAAHLTVALWHLLHFDWAEAVERVRRRIKRYNAANGVETTRERGYHETLTLFWMHYVRFFLEANYNEGCSLASLANTLIERAERNAPLTHYSRELLFSWEARLAWVEPDLKALPAVDSLSLTGA